MNNYLRVYIFFILFTVIAYLLSFVAEKNEHLVLKFYDVGQGDSIYIKYNDYKVIVDGGGNYELSRLVRNEFLFNKCEIDLMVLTHPHADHLKGLVRLLEYCKVKQIIFNNIDYDSNLYREFRQIISGKNVLVPKVGDIIEAGELRLIILSTEKGVSANNSSVVILLDYGGFEVLLTGDLEKEGFEKVDLEPYRRYIQGSLDVYKVAHHGAKSSLDEKFISGISPKKCVISVGKDNMYGHPHKKTLDFLEKKGCEVLRTDIYGTIEVLVD